MDESCIENWKPTHLVQIILSADFHVVGINDSGQELYSPLLNSMGDNLLFYHSGKNRKKVATLLQELIRAPSDMPRSLVIDVMGKVLMFNMSELTVINPSPQTLWSVTIFDVSRETGAVANPLSGMLQMKRIPVSDQGICRFLPTDSVYCVQSDGDYCKIYTPDKSYYLHSSLSNVLQRYTDAGFLRVHKSFVVNLAHVRRLSLDENGHSRIEFNNASIPSVPVSRRRVAELKRTMRLR